MSELGICQARVSDRCTGQAVHRHHRKRRSQGGDDSRENLLAVCPNCHDWIHANVAQAQGYGLLLESWVDPRDYPSHYTGAMQITIDGSLVPHEHVVDSEEETCPTCKGLGKRKKPKKREPARRRATWSVRVPADEREDGAAILDTWVELGSGILIPLMGWQEDVPRYHPVELLFKLGVEALQAEFGEPA